jgi:hypothetical protein
MWRLYSGWNLLTILLHYHCRPDSRHRPFFAVRPVLEKERGSEDLFPCLRRAPSLTDRVLRLPRESALVEDMRKKRISLIDA